MEEGGQWLQEEERRGREDGCTRTRGWELGIEIRERPATESRWMKIERAKKRKRKRSGSAPQPKCPNCGRTEGGRPLVGPRDQRSASTTAAPSPVERSSWDHSPLLQQAHPNELPVPLPMIVAELRCLFLVLTVLELEAAN